MTTTKSDTLERVLQMFYRWCQRSHGCFQYRNFCKRCASFDYWMTCFSRAFYERRPTVLSYDLKWQRWWAISTVEYLCDCTFKYLNLICTYKCDWKLGKMQVFIIYTNRKYLEYFSKICHFKNVISIAHQTQQSFLIEKKIFGSCNFLWERSDIEHRPTPSFKQNH